MTLERRRRYRPSPPRSRCFTARGRPINETVELVIEHTRRASTGDPNHARWNWAKEEADLYWMCYRFVNKVMQADGEDLGHTLPDALADRWDDIARADGIPRVGKGRHGFYVRVTRALSGRSQNGSQTGRPGPMSTSMRRPAQMSPT
jgi:hypothetical protein